MNKLAEEWKAQSGPILDRLGAECARVLRITKLSNGSFRLNEECDGYFYEDLTADELAQLGQELIDISKQEEPKNE